MTHLDNLIDRFLEDHRESRGGWAKVTPTDVGLLAEIVQWLIELKCDPDPDGDYPIEFRIINRRIYEGLRFHAVPYEHKAEQRERLRILAANLNMAANRLDTEIRCIE